jgi:hypothetical protein
MVTAALDPYAPSYKNRQNCSRNHPVRLELLTLDAHSRENRGPNLKGFQEIFPSLPTEPRKYAMAYIQILPHILVMKKAG